MMRTRTQQRARQSRKTLSWDQQSITVLHHFRIQESARHCSHPSHLSRRPINDKHWCPGSNPMKTEIPPQSCCLLWYHRKLNTWAIMTRVCTPNLRSVAHLFIDLIRQRRHEYAIHVDDCACLRDVNDNFNRVLKKIVRRACDIQAHFSDFRWRDVCCNKIDHVCVTDTVSDESVLIMIALKAELIRVTEIGGNGVVDKYTSNNGVWVEEVVCQFIGFEVPAFTGMIVFEADEVRDLGWARVNSAADIAFVIRWGIVSLILFSWLYPVTMAWYIGNGYVEVPRSWKALSDRASN